MASNKARHTQKYKSCDDIDAIIEIGDNLPEMEEMGFTQETVNLASKMKDEGFCIPHGPRKTATELGDKPLRRFLELVRNGMDPFDASAKTVAEVDAGKLRNADTKRRIWIRLGGVIKADEAAALAILSGDKDALVRALCSSGFSLEGETYIPAQGGIESDVDFDFSATDGIILKP